MVPSSRVHAVAQDLKEGGVPLAPFLPYFSYIHRIWYLYRQKEIYTDGKNFVPLLMGHWTNNFAASIPLKIGALSLQVVIRFSEYMEEQEEVKKSAKKLLHAIKGDSLPSVTCVWPKRQKGLLNTSTVIWLRLNAKKGIFRIHKIAVCTLIFGKHLFILSMRVWDLYEACSLDPRMTDEAVVQLFVNITSGTKKLLETKSIIMMSLNAKKPFLKKMLGNSLNPDSCIKAAECGFKCIEFFYGSGSHEERQKIPDAERFPPDNLLLKGYDIE